MKGLVILLGQHANEITGRALLLFVVAAAAVGFIYTPYDPLAVNWQQVISPPSTVHWFGTDQFGRDIFSRILSATGLSLIISASATILALVAGSFFGAIGGYFGGLVDKIVALVMDTLLAFPGILLALGLMVTLGPSGPTIALALGFGYTPTVYRVVRGSIFSIKEKEYIDASRALGDSKAYTLFFHVLPNCASPVLIMAASLFGIALLAESALSFLGLGVSAPTPTLGNMLTDGQQYIRSAPWMSIFPGITIGVVLLAINFTADALRDRFDPKGA